MSDLPVIKGELSNTWVHGNGTYPKAMSEFRRAKTEFYRMENMALERGLDISAEQDVFYKNALIFCEHTFGINVLKYFGQNRAFDKEGFERERETRSEYALAEESWREQEERVREMKKSVAILQDKLVFLPQKSIDDKLALEINIKNNKVYIKKGDKEYAIWYEYKIFGTKKMADFQRKYLTRFFDWSISDFGRNYYPEIPSESFYWHPTDIIKHDERIYIRFETNEKSWKQYGNNSGGNLVIWQEDGEIKILLDCGYKNATALLEAGNFMIEINEMGKSFFIEQAGIAVNVDHDIIKNANQVLWSVDRYARINNTVLQTYDAPLISFGKNAIFEFNGGTSRKKKPRFVVNLFNNQWGTNFPQWIEGKFSFEFSLTEV